MDWQGGLLILIVLWAVAHSVMDFKQSKKLEELEKKMGGGR